MNLFNATEILTQYTNMKFTVLLLICSLVVINLQPALAVQCFCKCCTTKGCTPASTPVVSYDVAAVCQTPSTCNSLGCSIKSPSSCTAPGADGNTEVYCGAQAMFNRFSVIITLVVLLTIGSFIKSKL
ncbi:unnamed protein product [Didymodactylos carnosus]|uniref:Uncharacterized protein n=1 Tax=Didymodactylos carnosus TaxID=1234261 RepID=A0A815HDT6_9BILA|nr:unnamed protein product [Didymodactylos carnosus]CAF1536003.1 unnamed protein product [Didymodactylos carnosus]CAF4223947.1 unnamed protein product [Didymodactylos carnosus]CAF4323677.1 unnamed protein product [Didymodactylos carnosus]